MKKLIIAALALSASASFAAPTVKTWLNPDCANGNCELKAMRLYTDKSQANRMAGTSMVAEIETTTKAQLKNYAIIQYIQGCLYETDSKGTIRMGSREFWARPGQIFKHVGYEIDSASDRDPIYWSNSNFGFDDLRGFFIPRNSYYENANSMLTESVGTWAGKISNLKENKLFVEDSPTPSAWDLNEETMKVTARISSLKFKICVHKIDDIPVVVDSPATEIPGALTCMTWDSNFNYNFATRKFEDKKDEISAVCK